MEDLGKTITEYRKKLNMTQKDLGERLNVSAQAVSKWENGQAEPDASTLKKLSEIFEISTDELLGITPPADETTDETAAAAAVTATAAAEAPAPQPQIIRETVVQQKIINGYCEVCQKPVGPNEYVVTGGGRTAQHIYCNDCNKKRIHAYHVSEYEDYKRQNKRSLIFGPLIAAGVTLLFCIVFMVIVKLNPLWAAALVAVGVFIGWLAFGIQVFWEDSVVTDIFFFFFKSFKMPGVIFTLDVDGLLFLLFVKIGGAILGAILSVLVFLFGLMFTPVASIFILPFAAIKRSFEGRQLKKAAEN